MIKTVDIEIGGQQIDKHYSEWLRILNELTQETGKKLGIYGWKCTTINTSTRRF